MTPNKNILLKLIATNNDFKDDFMKTTIKLYVDIVLIQSHFQIEC